MAAEFFAPTIAHIVVVVGMGFLVVVNDLRQVLARARQPVGNIVVARRENDLLRRVLSQLIQPFRVDTTERAVLAR